MNVLAISHPILIRFECSWALFKAGGYRNAYPYPYPSLPVVLTRAGLKTRGIHYLLVYQAEQRRLWHLAISSPQGAYNLSRIND